MPVQTRPGKAVSCEETQLSEEKCRWAVDLELPGVSLMGNDSEAACFGYCEARPLTSATLWPLLLHRSWGFPEHSSPVASFTLLHTSAEHKAGDACSQHS